MQKNSGQSLVELIVVIAVIVIVLGALTFATIASIRNAQFAKNQAQATKLAQEGLERVRSVRDRNSSVSYLSAGVRDWNWLWTNTISTVCGSSQCYMKLKSGSCVYDLCQIIGTTSTQEDIYRDGKFTRMITIEDGASFDTEKEVTSIVSWTDFSGSHESRLITILRKL